MKQTLSTGKAASLVPGISQRTIIESCKSGDLLHWLVPGSTHRRIELSDFIAWLDKHGVPHDLGKDTASTPSRELE